MKIHEYQAKELLASCGVPIPRGRVAATPGEAEAVARELGGKTVVKAQIHAGGRGKGGGIKLADDPAGAARAAAAILGMRLITHQTGPEGRIVRRVLVEEALEAERELYLAVVLGRAERRPVVVASEAGGVEIEEVARRSPERVLKAAVDPLLGVRPYLARRIAYGLGIPEALRGAAAAAVGGLYRLFVEKDCSLVEVNPWCLTREGRLLALDAKVNFDDNALYRHPEVEALRDLEEEDPLEVEASKHRLSYIRLAGEVGCMVNGAGLAMATMDIIKLAGASPANFLDLGGGASREAVERGFQILMGDRGVRAVLINIFGGILRCDVLAEGVVAAARKVKVEVPVVVRMEGTNVERGREILRESGLRFVLAAGMAEAAEKVVAALGRGGG